MIASAISAYVDDRPEKGIFRINTDAFSDPKLLDLEYTHIFERTRSFLGIESQISRNHDYLTGQIGRTPVLVMRDAEGRIGAYLNPCRHKGARLCWKERGNARFHHCRYHGWGYSSAGKIASIKDSECGRYGVGFDADAHDLVPLARHGRDPNPRRRRRCPPDTRPVAGFTGPFKIQNEVCFHPTWREWARLLGAGVSAGNS